MPAVLGEAALLAGGNRIFEPARSRSGSENRAGIEEIAPGGTTPGIDIGRD